MADMPHITGPGHMSEGTCPVVLPVRHPVILLVVLTPCMIHNYEHSDTDKEINSGTLVKTTHKEVWLTEVLFDEGLLPRTTCISVSQSNIW